MKKYARVKDILRIYEQNSLPGVILYLEDKDLIIDENTWISKIKNLLNEKKYYQSVEAEIASILHTFKLLK